MRKILQLKLNILASWILRKYQPIVVGITGSIGKTSAKEAVYTVLHQSFRVRMSPKNYNNEIGLPLTILGLTSPGRSFWGWLKLFVQAWGLIIFRATDYPEVLVLEMGVDRPGDMAYLVKIAPPTVGLVTAISHSHLEYFGSVANIQKEKQTLIEHVDHKGLSILNYDSEAAREMSGVSKARVLTYGLSEGANLQAQDIVFNFTKGNYELAGVNFKFNYNGAVVPVFLHNVMTESAIYAALAAAAVGLYFELNLIEVAQALSSFALPAGRMNILPGIKHTFIIDDTYNASPESVIAALDILGRIKVDEAASKYAVLGDMLELGHYTEEGHQAVGRKVASSQINYLIAIGERARDIERGSQAGGLSLDHIFYFDHAAEAARFLQNRLQAGDLVLVKASQGMRLEKVVKEIMAEPERASELLVRQGAEWKNK
jgi:UDP-N-acetylmuramoyl-tripeptide--D-alanyl-D-alanine ligase